jgi:folate-dependent phosphoribosylglycinamide formyltransferase PurN
MGSPEEVVSPLQHLLEHCRKGKDQLLGVISQPARPAGRKKRLTDPPVASFAKEAGLTVWQPEKASAEEFLRTLEEAGPDVIITAAYGQILSERFLKIPKRATINIHPSLLPVYRGATPVQTALLDGLTETGVTILFTVKALDAGPIISQKRFAIEANAHALARYAALCQEANIVPIVEPEVLMDGDHTIERCEEVTDAVLDAVFGQLFAHRIHLEGMVLKPNMVIAGKKCAQRAAPETVAQATVRCLKRHVPSAVPGIAFLSGGQSETEATHHLDLMNKIGGVPWALTFSYGRALQESTIKAWGGKAASFVAAQQALLKRARLNGLAQLGQYQPALEAA